MNSKSVFFVLFLFFVLGVNSIFFSQAKSSLIIARSTLGSSCVNNRIPSNFNQKKVLQSIGQSSVIGTFKNNSKTFCQGYIQPLFFLNLENVSNDLELEATLFPNPFISYFTIQFEEIINTEINLEIYDLFGRRIFSKIYEKNQNITISNWYNSISSSFTVKVTANKKLFTSKLINIE